ncbi:dihydrodipicolinate synthase family protein [Membranihabitans maritimus]|uniref:dihydrodipicolinate synthase family protein n=1 Tax=Membranihabitans maritimus TaxID=2904244 RepID=UPI001F001021|nr:dihydrodipicolinate synthase family protein [Membranihabitans maritimus]
MNNIFQGIWPAMFTPVDENGDPVYGELEKLVGQLVEEQVDGLYILGSTGQGILFKEEQRKEIAKIVIQIAKNKVPVMVQVGSLTTRESRSLAEHAGKIGAQGISSVGPIYFPGGADMVLEHYREIASVTDLPFFPYQLGNNSIKGDVVDFIKQLMEIPQVEGMKLTTTDLLGISTIHNFAGDKLKLFSGADELLCHSTLCGTVGAIGTTYNFWYKECSYVRDAFIKGDFELARSFMLEFQRIIFELLPNGWTFFRAAMMYKYNVDIGPAVKPVGNNNQAWKEADVLSLMQDLETASQLKIPTT